LIWAQLQGGGTSVDKLHDKARRAIESGEVKFRDPTEYLAEAQKLGASRRQSAKAIWMSPAWVSSSAEMAKKRDAILRSAG
jgi:hypothetical protein